MIYVENLTQEEVLTLSEMHKKHPRYLTRQRAHSILLSYKGISAQMIGYIYDVCRQTVSSWLSKWEKLGLCGLIDQAGRGRPAKLTDSKKILNSLNNNETILSQPDPQAAPVKKSHVIERNSS